MRLTLKPIHRLPTGPNTDGMGKPLHRAKTWGKKSRDAAKSRRESRFDLRRGGWNGE